MRSAHPIEDEAGAPGTGAHIVAAQFPTKNNTACAEVLCRLLSGEIMTGMEAVFGASTTRLAAHIHYLESKYGWQFERKERVNFCRDGRIVTIMTYSLSPWVIVATKGADEWCAGVREARRKLRLHAIGFGSAPSSESSDSAASTSAPTSF